MMQRKVYYVNQSTNEVMGLPVQPAKFYHVAVSAGWQRCSLKDYRRGLLKRKVTTGSYNLRRAA